MEAGSAVKRPLVRYASLSRAPKFAPRHGPCQDRCFPSFSQLIAPHGLLSPRCAQIRQDNDYLDKKESSVYLYKCITLWVLLIATCLAIWWCFVHEVNAEIRQVQLTNSSTTLPYNAYNQQHTTVTRTSMNNSTHTAQRASTTNLVDIHEHVLDKGSQKILTDRAEILAHAFSNRGSSFY